MFRVAVRVVFSHIQLIRVREGKESGYRDGKKGGTGGGGKKEGTGGEGKKEGTGGGGRKEGTGGGLQERRPHLHRIHVVVTSINS